MSRATDSSSRRPLLRWAGAAALIGAAAWIAKFLVIWAGSGSENVHGVLQVAGTLALLTALALWAWRAVASRGVPLRLLAVLAAWLVFFVAVGAVEEGLNAAIDAADDSVLEELVLLVVGVPALWVGMVAVRRSTGPATSTSQSR